MDSRGAVGAPGVFPDRFDPFQQRRVGDAAMQGGQPVDRTSMRGCQMFCASGVVAIWMENDGDYD